MPVTEDPWTFLWVKIVNSPENSGKREQNWKFSASGSYCVICNKQTNTWSIPQRKAIQEERTQGLREEKLTDVQKHYLVELRMALVKVEAIEAAQYA